MYKRQQLSGLVRVSLKPQAVINATVGGNIYLHEVAGNINLGIVEACLLYTSSAISTTKARKCHVTGGAGGVAAGASTSADTDLNVLTTVVLGTGNSLTADNINRILAQSSMDANGWAKIDTGGAVTFNRTQSNVCLLYTSRCV